VPSLSLPSRRGSPDQRSLPPHSLKTALNLPPIISRPPIPPRPYKKLYDYISASVPSAALSTGGGGGGGGTPKTPRKNRHLAADSNGAPGSRSRPLPSRATPGKDAALAQFRPTRSSARTPRAPHAGNGATTTTTDAGAGLPLWVPPTIRFLCQSTGGDDDDNNSNHAHLAPTVLAGVEAIVAPGGRPTTDEWILAHLAGLVGGIYLYVATQAERLRTGEDVLEPAYDAYRRAIMARIARARDEVAVGGKKVARDDGSVRWHGFAPIGTPREFNNVVKEISKRGWLAADWFWDIGHVVRTQLQKEGEKEAEGRGGGEGGGGGGGGAASEPAARRADTMLQAQFDFLSGARVAEYRVWKTEMLDTIRVLRARGGGENGDMMDLD
jgi:origin recognition complex subunit 6